MKSYLCSQWTTQMEKEGSLEVGGSRRAVYSFPAASVTNYRLGGLKQHNFIILQFWRSKPKINFTGLESRADSFWRPEAWGKILFYFYFSCLSYFWRRPAFLGSWPLPWIIPNSCFLSHISFFLLWSPCLPLVSTLWSHWTHLDNLGDSPISGSLTSSHLQVSFAMKVTFAGSGD